MVDEVTFSVVTPCFNSEQYIAETIESVLSQSGPFKIQYIIIDGGSNDLTLKIIDKYKNKVEKGFYEDKNLGIDIKVISEPDHGMYDALAKGFTYVEGNICSYINSDDFYQLNAFRSVLAAFIWDQNANWITGIPNVYNSFGANIKRMVPFEYRSDFIRKGLYGNKLNYIQQESVFWRTSLMSQISLAKLSHFKLAGDYYLWHEFSKKNKLWIVDSIISGFRTHSNNKSVDMDGYKREFDSIVSERMSIKDKIDFYRHKKKWGEVDNVKRKFSNSYISLYYQRLQDNYHKFEAWKKKDKYMDLESNFEPKHKPYLSIVIGSYNRLMMLKLCIEAIRSELNGITCEIIVIDGGSTDGTMEWLLEQKDIITIIQHNRGEWKGKTIERKPWAYFMNLGFKAASGRFVCMLSDDSLIIPGAIKNGLQLFEDQLSKDEKVGAVAFYFRDYPIRKKYAVAINLGNLYVNHGLYLKSAVEEAGYIDENYHFYFADTDLILKIKSLGYKCIASQNSFVEHYFEATPDIRASNNDPKKELDRLRLINKWKGIAYPEEDYDKYLKVVGYWDYHPVGFTDKHNTITRLIDACND